MRLEQGYFTYRSGLEAAERLLTAEPYPTAIFAANDDMAAAAVSLAHRIGFEVPEDLSIAGFDDTPIAASVWPALTTIHQPVAAMARAAVDLVLEEVRRQRDGTGAPRQLLHPHPHNGPEPTAARPPHDAGEGLAAAAAGSVPRSAWTSPLWPPNSTPRPFRFLPRTSLLKMAEEDRRSGRGLGASCRPPH